MKKFLFKKWILEKYLPDNLINKSKKGFSIPLDSILINEIKNNYLDCYQLCKRK